MHSSGRSYQSARVVDYESYQIRLRKAELSWRKSLSADIIKFPNAREPKVLTPHDRLEALLLATINDERAQLCAKGQEGLRTIFEMNAKLLRRLAT